MRSLRSLPRLPRAFLAALALAGTAAAFGCGGGGGGGGPEVPFGIPSRVPVTTLTFPTSTPSPGNIQAVEAFPSLPAFSNPVFVTAAPGDTSHLFVVEQRGSIRVFTPGPGVSSYSTFLDLTGLVTGDMGEEGLLGLAFHPGYATNKTFYVYYTAASGARRSVISRFKVTGSDPLVANGGSETIVMEVAQPAANHNGGMMAFGPDGFLYVGLGDGGGGGDSDNHALDTSDVLGKMLRISVDPDAGVGVYGIPATNPFAMSSTQKKEIYAWGFRNPWRWSFDRVQGTLWLGDVGQETREEIDVVEKGKSYGWRAWEGTNNYSPGDNARGPFVTPVIDYGRSLGNVVVGGYVYHGTTAPTLGGSYVYGDHGSGRIWSLTWDGIAATSNVEIAQAENPSSFGEDASGELFVCEYYTGRLKRFSETGGGGGGTIPATLSATGIFANTQNLVPNPGLVPYDVNVPLWSDGALKDRLIALPGVERITWSADGRWSFPLDTVLVKTFRLPLVAGDPSSAVKVETRVLLQSSNGWQGYVYRWRDDGTDADLLPGADTRTFTVTDAAAPGGQRDQTWAFPSRSDCLRCHTAAAGRVLGVDTRQMNRDFDYGGTVDNQLRSWGHAHLLDSPTPHAESLPAHPLLSDALAPVAARARAYLEVNCAMCHRPGGTSQAAIDLRSTIPVGSMNVVNVRPQYGDLGLPDPWIVKSGDRLSSVLWRRMETIGGPRMPPLATSLPDADGLGIVGAWIDQGP